MEVITLLLTLRKRQDVISSQRLKFSYFSIFASKITTNDHFFEAKLKNFKILVSDLKLHPVAFGELRMML